MTVSVQAVHAGLAPLSETKYAVNCFINRDRRTRRPAGTVTSVH
jgi:hypothetical protein